VLALCGQRGLVDLSAVAVDGSPMHANAARSSNRTLQQLEAVVADGEARIARWMTGEAPNTAPSPTQPAASRQAAPSDVPWGRLARLGDRIARACTARDKLYERAARCGVVFDCVHIGRIDSSRRTCGEAGCPDSCAVTVPSR
jgi:hypothetical protein